jgi:hypothetical protein
MATKAPGRKILLDAAGKIRTAADETGGLEYRARLAALADELESVSGHSYLQTHRGREEAARLIEEISALSASLAACNEDEPAHQYCENFTKRLEQLIEHARALESR